MLTIKPWWRADGNGNFLLTLKSCLKVVEFEKGKAAISVGPQEKLKRVLDTLIAATRAGKLDRLLEPASGLEQQVAQR